MPSSGGGNSGTQKMEPWDGIKQPLLDYIGKATQMQQDGIHPYEGQRVADFNPMQGAGYQMLNDYMLQGTPERAAGGAASIQAMQGGMNPYATQQNPMAGMNPYMAQMINSSNDAITQNFSKGTAAQTDMQAAQQGAFGGSAYNERVQDNQKTLGGLLGQNTNSLLNQQYDRTSNLNENALNRSTGAYDSAQQRALQAVGLGQGQQGIDLQAILAGIQGGNGLADYQQKLLNANKGLYDEKQQAPFTMMDFLGNALSRGMGGFGQQTTTSPGASPWATGAGLGLAGYGLLGQ